MSKAAIFFFAILTLISCSHSKTDISQSGDAKWTPIPVRFATGFRLWTSGNISRVEIRNPQDTTEIWQTLELVRGPSQGTDQVTIPVGNYALGSTTFMPYFEKLDLLSRISGVTHIDMIWNENISATAITSNWLELAPGGELDPERLVSISPAVFLCYDLKELERFKSSTAQPILHLEYLESHPLGRAEWILLIACLADKLEEGQAIFEAIESRYLRLKNLAALSSGIPSVVIGNRYADKWYAPSGKSYLATLLRDASANYQFQNLEGAGSKELDYEVVFSALNETDFWGMVISQDTPFTREDLMEINPYLAGVEALKGGRVFACNSQETDYFGAAVLEPEIVLADLIQIFRPSSLPDHRPKYFHLLP